MAERFTKPYVDALFAVAGSPDAVEKLVPGLEVFARTLAHSDQLRSLFLNPRIDRTRRLAVLDAIAKKEDVPDLAVRLLHTLLAHRRIARVSAVVTAVKERLDKERRIREAVLTTAAPIGEASTKAIREALEKKTGQGVRLLSKVDAELLGGFVLKVESEVYDASLAHRLEKARHALHSVSGAAH